MDFLLLQGSNERNIACGAFGTGPCPRLICGVDSSNCSTLTCAVNDNCSTLTCGHRNGGPEIPVSN